MQIEIKIDGAYFEPKVIILADKVDDQINALVKRLSEENPQMIAGFRDDEVRLLAQEDMISIYASEGKVFCRTGTGTYTLRLRLYELEERLDRTRFVRISNSEIINLKKVRNFDLSLSGTICVTLSDGTATYVSRRYVSKIKKVLGL